MCIKLELGEHEEFTMCCMIHSSQLDLKIEMELALRNSEVVNCRNLDT